VGLGDTLRLQTVAEGVEMAEQRAALIELGCPLGQGHFFSRALPSEGIDRILTGRRSLIPPHSHAHHHGAAPKAAVPRDAS
jgi:EAL domain-containing protein (putative c-di-GMP-specific phosphodiesterase class I)